VWWLELTVQAIPFHPLPLMPWAEQTGVIEKTIPLAVKYLSDPTYAALDAESLMLGSNIPKGNTIFHATVNDQEYVAINAPAFNIT